MGQITNKQIAVAFAAAKSFIGHNKAECVIPWECLFSGSTGQMLMARPPLRYLSINHALYYVALPGSWDAMQIIKKRFLCDKSPMCNDLGTIARWLHFECDVPRSHLTDDNLLAYYHRWLDSVIYEFQQKE